MKLKIKNFQSINEADIDIKGFVTITGPSNRGKSALIRSVGALFFNDAGNESIQSGASRARVSIVDGSNIMLFWERNLNGQVYLVLNGKTHTRVARDYLKLVEPTGFREVVTKNKTFRPQLAMQHEGPYLLAETPNTAAEVLQVVGHVDTVNRAQKFCSTDTKDATSLLAIRKKDVSIVDDRLIPYHDFQTILDDLGRATLQSFKVKEQIEKYDSAQEALDFISAVNSIGEIPDVVTIDIEALLKSEKTLRSLINLRKGDLKVPEKVVISLPTIKVHTKNRLELLLKIKRVVVNHQAELLRVNIEGQQIKENIYILEDALKVCPECKRPYEGK